MKFQKAGDDEHPICPYCEVQLSSIKAKKFDKGFFKVTEKQVYLCPHCSKVLGVAQSAWMP